MNGRRRRQPPLAGADLSTVNGAAAPVGSPRPRRWRWVALGSAGLTLVILGTALTALAITRDDAPAAQAEESSEMRVAIDTCHYRTAGGSTRCGPASFRETPGGTKLFTVPVDQTVTLVCRDTGPAAENNQQPPSRRSTVWARARDSKDREGWVSAIVVDAWPPDTWDLPNC